MRIPYAALRLLLELAQLPKTEIEGDPYPRPSLTTPSWTSSTTTHISKDYWGIGAEDDEHGLCLAGRYA